MGCCCLNILNLCNKPICGILELPQQAAADSGSGNEYSLILDYFDTQVILTEDQTEGEDIHFDISGLNENFQYTGKLYGPDGAEVAIGEFDCVRFKTVVNIAGVLAAPVLDDNDTFVILE